MPFSCSRVNANGLARTRSVAVMITRGERVMTSYTRGAAEQLLVEVLDFEVAAAHQRLGRAGPSSTGASTLCHRSFSVS